ncbi:MAG: hypothetical protein JEZ09_10050 [Salinivirgaceae bacterium]|nr:hypothetical protein [Salinivirgaceae bacterium]
MKNYFLNIIPFLVILLLLSCNKDEREPNQPTQNYFDFIVNRNSYSNSQFWIIINSADGKIINSQAINENATYRIDLPEHTGFEKYTVQFISGNVWVNEGSIYCYTEVEPCNWNYYHLTDTHAGIEPIGTETIEFDKDLLESGPFGSYLPLYTINNKNYSYSNENSHNIDENIFQIDQFFDLDHLYIVLFNGNEIPIYKWIDNVKLNASYYLKAEDFKQMDEMTISFPNDSSNYIRIETADDPTTEYHEYYKVYDQHGLHTKKEKAYYPKDLFSDYWTYLSSLSDLGYEYYVKRNGNIPTSFKQIDADIQVQNTAVQSFTASTTGNADYCELNWNFENNNSMIRYSVYNSFQTDINFSAPEIPQFLVDSFEINLDHSYKPSITLYEYDNYSGYPDFIKNRFIQPGVLWENINEYQWKKINSNNLKSTKLENEEEMILKERQRKY